MFWRVSELQKTITEKHFLWADCNTLKLTEVISRENLAALMEEYASKSAQQNLLTVSVSGEKIVLATI